MTSKRKPSPMRLTLAVEGEGLGPNDIPLRHLAELLEAAAATFEALAAEKQIDPPRLSLSKITSGSARYELVSEDRQAARIADAFWTAVKHRGKGASQRTRHQLGRLYRAATRTGGALRIEPIDSKRAAKAIYLAIPIEEDRARIEEATVVFARVVGINIDSRENASVTLRYDDGGSGEFDADLDVLAKAAELIGQLVEANVTFAKGEETRLALGIERIRRRKPQSSFMATIEEVRQSMTAKGSVYDSTKILAEDEGTAESDRG
ncbi:MAG TPA: hypothetical protein VFK02_24880 [Kofleriaceae bacterium]|nr:hypothetical protein [Kofleriaceae bacterium]